MKTYKVKFRGKNYTVNVNSNVIKDNLKETPRFLSRKAADIGELFSDDGLNEMYKNLVDFITKVGVEVKDDDKPEEKETPAPKEKPNTIRIPIIEKSDDPDKEDKKEISFEDKNNPYTESYTILDVTKFYDFKHHNPEINVIVIITLNNDKVETYFVNSLQNLLEEFGECHKEDGNDKIIKRFKFERSLIEVEMNGIYFDIFKKAMEYVYERNSSLKRLSEKEMEQLMFKVVKYISNKTPYSYHHSNFVALGFGCYDENEKAIFDFIENLMD